MKTRHVLFTVVMISCLFLISNVAIAQFRVVTPPSTILPPAGSSATGSNAIMTAPASVKTTAQLAPLSTYQMSAALPMEMPTAKAGVKQYVSLSEVQPEGRAVLVKGTLGEADGSTLDAVMSSSVFSSSPTAAPTLYPGTPAYNYPFPFTRFEVFDTQVVSGKRSYRKYPYRTIGQLYFEIPGKGLYRCSGAVARTNWVWTTGHCVITPPYNWHTNFTFIPGARNSVKPYGTWTYAGDAVALEGWGVYGELCYDIGAVKFNEKNGKTLQERVGSLGFAANIPDLQHWMQFGYPAASPFNGKRLIQVASSIAQRDPYMTCCPKPIGLGNDMTGGCSGGPWILCFGQDSPNNNFINGMNSYRYIVPSEPKALYGPYFGNGAVNIWDYIVANP